MNEGGSTLGGNQTVSGGTDAFDSTALKISHDSPSPDSLSIDHSPSPVSDPAPSESPAPVTPPEVILPNSDTITKPTQTDLNAPSSAPAPAPEPTPETPSTSPLDTSSDIPITESVIIQTSNDQGAHLFGQDISGITDEDLGPKSNIAPVQTVIFPGSTESLAPEPEPTPELTPAKESTSSGVASLEPEPTPKTPATQATPSTPPVATPVPEPEPTPEPPAPIAYEQQFLQNLHNPSDSGDIILDPEAANKPKKGLVIALVVGALTICVIGLVAILAFSRSSTNPSNPSNTINTSSTTALEDFYSYSNEILYGETTTEPIDREIEDGERYVYLQTINNGEQSNQEYAEELYQKFHNFMEKWQSENENIKDGELYDAITDYDELLSFIRINPSSSNFNIKSVIDAYLGNGEEAANGKKEEILSQIPDDNQFASSFKDLKDEAFENAINYMILLDETGCIQEGEIYQMCIELDWSGNPEIYDYSNTFLEDELDSSTILDDIYEKIGTDCEKIKELLEGDSQQ